MRLEPLPGEKRPRALTAGMTGLGRGLPLKLSRALANVFADGMGTVLDNLVPTLDATKLENKRGGDAVHFANVPLKVRDRTKRAGTVREGTLGV